MLRRLGPLVACAALLGAAAKSAPPRELAKAYPGARVESSCEGDLDGAPPLDRAFGLRLGDKAVYAALLRRGKERRLLEVYRYEPGPGSLLEARCTSWAEFDERNEVKVTRGAPSWDAPERPRAGKAVLCYGDLDGSFHCEAYDGEAGKFESVGGWY